MSPSVVGLDIQRPNFSLEFRTSLKSKRFRVSRVFTACSSVSHCLKVVQHSLAAAFPMHALLTLAILLCAHVGATTCPTPVLAWLAPNASIGIKSDPTNKYGLEDGIVVRRADGRFQLLASAMYGDPVWVRMRLDVYTSSDALHWSLQRSLRASSGNFDGSDPHSSSWGPFFVHDPANDTWALSYIGYRGAPSNASGWLENFRGQAYGAYASASGDAGLDEDFGDATYRASDTVLLAPDDYSVPGPWPHVCQGLQGTDSFYPYPLADGTWAALVGTSHQETPNPWPGGKWPVSLARAPALAGPWTRYNPTGGAPADAPCVDLNGGFSENPIVSRRADSPAAFQLLHDFLSAEAQGFGYACSEDGLAWQPSVLVRTPFGARTPLGMLPMTAAEAAAMTPELLAYGVLNASQIGAAQSALSWVFYTSCPPPGGDWCIGRAAAGGWESVYTGIVYQAWQ
jgi:hypothetical protein